MRLIDADALMKTLGITNMDCEKCAWYDKKWTRCKRGRDFEDACCAIEDAPTITQNPNEWCAGCKEYDSEKHCCPRFNHVIRKAMEQRWIPVTERLPKVRDWYLGIFKEPDTGWINPIPFICEYLLGTKTKATTKEGWILKECTDGEEHIDYYFNLECVAWMPLPEPYTESNT